MIQTMKLKRRVSFEDCDPFAHLNNANYLNYFLNARDTQLRENQVLDLLTHAKETGKGWVVTSHDIRYLRPAVVGEELEIWSRMLTFDQRANLVEFLMVSPEKKQLKSILHSRFTYVSIDQARPVKMEPKIQDLFHSISLFPARPLADFHVEERIAQVKTELKAAA